MIKKKILNLLSPQVKKFLIKNFKKYHSLELIDKKMLKYINYRNGFYIELGAHDGIKHSNTYYFEKYKNWSGILIEPSNHYNQLKKNRSNQNIFFNVVCVPFKFKKKVIFKENSDFSTCDELVDNKYLAWHKKMKILYKISRTT